MNKKLIALAMILLLAVGGLFAVYTVDVPADVTAMLKANIGEYLNHGFTVNGVKSVIIEDAFTTDPSFTYGYETNAQGKFDFQMTVGNFVHTDGQTEILIKAVKKGAATITPVTVSGDTFYRLFDIVENPVSTGSVKKSSEATFTIVPAKKTHDGTLDHLGTTTIGNNSEYTDYADDTDSTPGSYTANVTIAISAS
jgi:hypothetical protein